MITRVVQNTRVILPMILKILCECAAFPQKDIFLYMISRHEITLKVLEHSKNVKEYLSRMTRDLARHEYHRERLEYNEEIGNQMPCKTRRDVEASM